MTFASQLLIPIGKEHENRTKTCPVCGCMDGKEQSLKPLVHSKGLKGKLEWLSIQKKAKQHFHLIYFFVNGKYLSCSYHSKVCFCLTDQKISIFCKFFFSRRNYLHYHGTVLQLTCSGYFTVFGLRSEPVGLKIPWDIRLKQQLAKYHNVQI